MKYEHVRIGMLFKIVKDRDDDEESSEWEEETDEGFFLIIKKAPNYFSALVYIGKVAPKHGQLLLKFGLKVV
jgi:hypothetical protein